MAYHRELILVLSLTCYFILFLYIRNHRFKRERSFKIYFTMDNIPKYVIIVAKNKREAIRKCKELFTWVSGPERIVVDWSKTTEVKEPSGD